MVTSFSSPSRVVVLVLNKLLLKVLYVRITIKSVNTSILSSTCFKFCKADLPIVQFLPKFRPWGHTKWSNMPDVDSR